ncbi:MAG: 16S rRNA (cytosine(967)-C(5))-methyltransferase RsmB [Pseudomonadota bacterium]
MKNPRHLALLILLDVGLKKLPLDMILDSYSTHLAQLSPKDRSLANALIFGVLRWQENLDWMIQCFSSRDMKQIQPNILTLLRLGLYQMVYMERIPVSAAVNTAVDIAKDIANIGAVGFVNAVLRKASAGWKNMTPPDLESDPVNHLRIRQSMPQWLIQRWIKRYGSAGTLDLCTHINTIPPITVRANTLKTDRQTLSLLLEADTRNLELTAHSPDGISFTHPSLPIHEIQAFSRGLFQVQDEAAQIVSLLLDPRPGENVLDACAGLGGKTGHLAQLMDNTGTLIAVDTSTRKLSCLMDEMKRLGITIASSLQADLLTIQPEDFPATFDRILLDAPCTGLGVLRRNPDSKWARTAEDITRMAGQQKIMLDRAAALLKPGGVLVFAVCSSEPQENEEVILDFLKHRKNFSISKRHDRILSTATQRLISEDGFFRSWPGAPVMDGFFAAALVKGKDAP